MRSTTFGFLLILAVVVSACGSGTAQSSQDVSVSIFGPYRHGEADLFTASFDDFAAETGIEIVYTGTGSFVTDLESQVDEAADAPDIAVIPQRGLVNDLAREERLAPLPDEVVETIEANFDERALALGSVDETLIAIPFRTSLKSIVWYRPTVFEEFDLAVPKDMGELEALAQRIEGEITTPWCLGLEAQGATGWVATDWTEDLLLREAHQDVYIGWVVGDVDFEASAIADAYESFRQLVLIPGRLAGGLSGALRRPVDSAFEGLFEDEPQCVLYRQASFAYDWMPDDTTFGPDGDIDFFVLPAETRDTDPPLLLGEDLAVAFNDRPEVAAVMKHLAEPEATANWVEAGGFTSLSKTSNGAERRPVDQKVMDLLLGNKGILALDASDAMPPDIGTTLLWDSITEWVAGGLTYEELAEIMDQARDAVTAE